jgi:hypothetical protein
MDLLIGLILLALTIHGLYLAFVANIILGIVALFLPPSGVIFSLVYLLAKQNLPEMIMSWIRGKSGSNTSPSS